LADSVDPRDQDSGEKDVHKNTHSNKVSQKGTEDKHEYYGYEQEKKSAYFVKTLSFPVVGNALGALFLAYTATIILAHLFAEDEITSDVIMGAICVYFLIGLIWAFVFSTLEMLQPGSFQMPQGTGTELSNFSYYSYVTLTTLGYGDITPISAPARSLALLEAIMGQLYIAILIARLVGIHISQSRFRQQPDKD